MRRFITIETDGVYSIECDTFNFTYAVYIRCDRFKQQISKSYVKKGWAYRRLNRESNSNKIKL